MSHLSKYLQWNIGDGGKKEGLLTTGLKAGTMENLPLLMMRIQVTVFHGLYGPTTNFEVLGVSEGIRPLGNP